MNIELTRPQINQLKPLTDKIRVASEICEPGMLIAQIYSTGMVMVCEFIPHAKSMEIQKAMNPDSVGATSRCIADRTDKANEPLP